MNQRAQGALIALIAVAVCGAVVYTAWWVWTALQALAAHG